MGVDIVGYADIVGDSSVNGPAPQAGGNPFAAMLGGLLPHMQGHGAPALVAHSPHGAAVSQRQQNVTRRQLSPLPATTVPASGTALQTWRPQRFIRVQRLILQSNTSPSGVSVSEFNVGAIPQFINAGNVPIGVFAAQAFDTELRGDTAQPGMDVSLTFANSLAAAEVVTGALIGEALQV